MRLSITISECFQNLYYFRKVLSGFNFVSELDEKYFLSKGMSMSWFANFPFVSLAEQSFPSRRIYSRQLFIPHVSPESILTWAPEDN